MDQNIPSPLLENEGDTDETEQTASSSSSVVGVSPASSTRDFSPPTPVRGRHDLSSTSSGPSTPDSRSRKRTRRTGSPSRSTLQRRRRESSESLLEEHGDEDPMQEQHDGSRDPGADSLGAGGAAQHNVEPELGVEMEISSSSDDTIVEEDNVSESGSSRVSGGSSCSGPHSSNYDSVSDDQSNNSNTVTSVSDIQLLFDGSEMTIKQAVLEVLKLYVDEKWTKKSLDKQLKLVKRLLPQPNGLPTNSSQALNLLFQWTSFYEEHNTYFYCSDCLSPVDSIHHACDCGCRETGCFYSFFLEQQIKHMFEQRGLASIIDYHRENHGRKEGYISDIQDGTEYLRVKHELLGQYDLVLMWNTDGVQLSSSSKQELWPILCTISEIPPRLRPYFMLVCGVYVDQKKKINMSAYLKPFVDSLAELFRNGVTWVHPDNNTLQTSKVIAPILCADAPAKAKVLQVKGHNAKYGCNVCEQRAVLVDPNPVNVVIHPALRKRRKRCLVFRELPAELRNGARMEIQGRVAEATGAPRKGVIGNSVVSDIPCFDRGSSACSEYLHNVCLGVVKYFLNLILFVSGPWYIGEQIEDIDNFVLGIKVPHFVKRLPRGFVDNFKFMKGSELRAFLLYYSLPAFEGRMKDQYFQHWLLLVAAMHLLLAENISNVDVESAEVMLRCFVRDVGPLYGNKYYTYNVHNLLHLCLSVRRWGPLWATSAFTFENYNGVICSNLHGTKHLGKELLNYIKRSQCVAALENIVNGSNFVFPRVPSLPQSQFLGKPLNVSVLLDQEREVLANELYLGCFVLYSRVKIMSKFFTSKVYDSKKKRSNSLVQYWSLHDNDIKEYGEIRYFLKSENGSAMYCLIENFRIQHVRLFFHNETRCKVRNLLPVTYSGNLLVLPVDKIICQVLKVGMYVALRPNSVEVNL